MQLAQGRLPTVPRRWWTTKELSRLRKHAEEGLSIKQAAQELERSFFSVAEAARRYLIPFFAKAGRPKKLKEEEDR